MNPRLRQGYGAQAARQGYGAQAVAVALAAFALFTLEPFVGKALLPRLGGTPMVWNTCVMVFQGLLLAGYLYSVWLVRHPQARRLHVWLSIITVVTWPISVRLLWHTPPDIAPVLWVTTVITAGVGLAFVVLSATSPLMQVWAGQAGATTTAHRLYSVSNVASVGALVAYVVVIEPLLGLRSQSLLIWALLVLVAMVVSALVKRARPLPSGQVEPHRGESAVPRVPASVRVKWGALSFAASLVLYALAPTLPLAVVAIFAVGALYLGTLSSFTTVAQLRAPAELRGRVVSVLMMLIGAL